MQCSADTKCGLQCERKCSENLCWQHNQIPEKLLKKFAEKDYFIDPYCQDGRIVYMIESKEDERRAIDTFGTLYDENGNFVSDITSVNDIKILSKKFPNSTIVPYFHKKLGHVYFINRNGAVGAANYYDSNGKLLISIPVVPLQILSRSEQREVKEWYKNIGKEY